MDKSIYIRAIKHKKEHSKHWLGVIRRKMLLFYLEEYKTHHSENKLDIVDMGCQTGNFLENLEKYNDNLYGFDIEDIAIDYCRKNLKANIEKGSLPDNIPFSTNFDFITLMDVLEHVEDDSRALKNINSRLRADGLFICTVPAYQFIYGPTDKMVYHFRRYSLPQLKKLLTEAGFSIKKISYFNTFLFLPALIVRMVEKLLKLKNTALVDSKISGGIFNSIFYQIFRFETFLLTHGGG
jgi:2-polyprenyl-3-methyl-5-hydroxy-6-metoxy-1,4-benzoquinol methylase